MSTYNDFHALSKEQQARVLLACEGEVISDRDLEQQHDDMLDECCDPVKIGTLTYLPSAVLQSVDPVAYNCSFSDWLGTSMDDVVIELAGNYYPCEAIDAAIAALEEGAT